jgi:hypothetical protein
VAYVPIVVQNMLCFVFVLIKPNPVDFETMRQIGWFRNNNGCHIQVHFKSRHIVGKGKNLPAVNFPNQ